MRALRVFQALRVAALPLLIALLLPIPAHGSDTLLIHGHIYTGNPKAPWAQALAITGTRIDVEATRKFWAANWRIPSSSI
jgi:hypothetical protein